MDSDLPLGKRNELGIDGSIDRCLPLEDIARTGYEIVEHKNVGFLYLCPDLGIVEWSERYVWISERSPPHPIATLIMCICIIWVISKSQIIIHLTQHHRIKTRRIFVLC